MTRFPNAAEPRTSHPANEAYTLELVVADARIQPTTQSRVQRKDLYEVLGVSHTATLEEIKMAFKRMALKYHPDKNGNDPVASDIFQEVKFAYSILSDPSKRLQYDKSGFEAIEFDRQKLDVDLSNLNPVSTMFVALSSKLGVPIRTTVPVTLLKQALDGKVKIFQLPLGQSEHMKVEKLSAKFYCVDITESEAKAGLVCHVHSSDRSKFKLLYFTLEENGGLNLALQEDSVDTGNGTSAGMYFLGFPVYRFEHNYSESVTKNNPTAFFKMLDSYQSCDINELKPGTHYFAVYGDNYFYPASYTVEFVCGQSFLAEKENLKNVEAKILAKRAAYREGFSKLTEMKGGYDRDRQTIDELLKERNAIHASFIPPKQGKQKKANDLPMEGQHNDSSDKRTNTKHGGWFKKGQKRGCIHI